MQEDFFILLHNMLTGRPEVSEVHCVKDAKVPLMRFKLDGISFDLPYAQLKVMSIPEVSVSSVSLSLSNTVKFLLLVLYTRTSQGSHLLKYCISTPLVNAFFFC